MTNGEKLKQLRRKLRWSQERIAVELGVTRGYVSQMENDVSPIRDYILERMEVLDKLGPQPDIKTEANRNAPTLPLKPIRRVPILSWAQAGELRAYEELPSSWHEMTFTDCQDENCFAVEIEGDSMEPKFSAGELAIVMPNVSPRNGCLVVCRLRNDGVYFKLFHHGIDGKTVRLTSYNPAYPVMQLGLEEFQWVYPVHSITRNVWR